MDSPTPDPDTPAWAFDGRRLAILETRFDGPIPAHWLVRARRDPAAAQIARLSGQAHAYRRLAQAMIAALRRHPGNRACHSHLGCYRDLFRLWNRAAWNLRRHQETPLPRGRAGYEAALRASCAPES